MRYLLFFKSIFAFMLSCFCQDLQSYQSTTQIETPCVSPSLYCVREYLTTHSGCWGKLPKNDNILYLKSNTVYLPNFNVTVTQENMRISGLESGNIEGFYVNKATDKAVLTVSFKNIGINATTHFRYHQRSREPEMITSETTEIYSSIETTTIMQGASHPQLRHSETYAHVSSLPMYTLGEGVLKRKASDPRVTLLFAEFESNIDIAVQESFLTRGPLFAFHFIQEYICDFGLQLI